MEIKQVEQKKEITYASTNLPPEIVEIILQRLPVKSLLRFKIVCKSWNAIISDYEFTKSHHHLQQLKIKNSSSSEANIFLWRPPSSVDRDYRLVKFKNNKFQVETIHKQPDASIHILCFADGLALFACWESYLLWNPRTKQERIISPCPHQEFALGREAKAFGFCRGPALDDYKIVALYSDDCYTVYSCKNRLWSEKKKFPFSSDTNHYWGVGGLFVDGFSFWVISETVTSMNYEILYFDPRHETFSKLQMPEKITKERRVIYLISLSGCLCLYYMEWQQLRIWKLRDNNVDDSSNSWSEFMNIRVISFNKPIGWIHIRPLFLAGKNKLVIGKEPWEKEPVHGIYDSNENKCEKLESSLSNFDSRPSITIRFLDTLFFPA